MNGKIHYKWSLSMAMLVITRGQNTIKSHRKPPLSYSFPVVIHYQRVTLEFNVNIYIFGLQLYFYYHITCLPCHRDAREKRCAGHGAHLVRRRRGDPQPWRSPVSADGENEEGSEMRCRNSGKPWENIGKYRKSIGKYRKI